MKILFLGYGPSETRLHGYLRAYGHEVDHEVRDVRDTPALPRYYDLVVAFGYRHILTPAFLSECRRPPLNLHISLLPWNRGAHPNFWAHYDGTPHGVSLIEMDERIDTGPVVDQMDMDHALAPFPAGPDTLAETYSRLRFAAERLFIDRLAITLARDYLLRPQDPGGSFHKAADLPKWEGGWDLTIDEIRKRIEEAKAA